VATLKDWFKNNPLFDVVYDEIGEGGKPNFGTRRDFSQTSIN